MRREYYHGFRLDFGCDFPADLLQFFVGRMIALVHYVWLGGLLVAAALMRSWRVETYTTMTEEVDWSLWFCHCSDVGSSLQEGTYIFGLCERRGCIVRWKVEEASNGQRCYQYVQ